MNDKPIEKLDIVALNRARDEALEKEYPKELRDRLSDIEKRALIFGFYSGWKVAVQHLTGGKDSDQ